MDGHNREWFENRIITIESTEERHQTIMLSTIANRAHQLFEERDDLRPYRGWLEGEGTLMKRLQRGASIKTNTIGSLALSLGALILLPTLSATEAQSSQQTAAGQTKQAVVDHGVDSLQQFSSSMELLSKRVSPSVVQIFSTGYNLDTEHEHGNTNLFSRRSSSGSGIIIAGDGWIVTNAHVVEGSRRIRVRLNQEGDGSAPQNGRPRHALLEAQ